MKTKVTPWIIAFTVLVIIIGQILMGCNASNTAKGGAIGAGVGGVAGGKRAAVIGAGAGAAGSYIYSRHTRRKRYQRRY